MRRLNEGIDYTKWDKSDTKWYGRWTYSIDNFGSSKWGIVITEPYKTKKDDKYIIGMYHDNRDNIRIYTNLSYKDSKEFNKLLDRLEKVTTDDYYKTTLSIAKLPIGSIVDRQRSNISEDITHQYPFDEWIDKLTK